MEETNNSSSNKMNPMLIGAVVIVLLIIGAIVVLGKGAGSMTDSNTTTSPNPDAMMQDEEMMESTDEAAMEGDDRMMMEDGEVKEFTLEAGSFYFKPDVINVKKGDKVKVTINSVDMMHDFVIDEFDARTEVAKSGTSASVEFTADKAGSFEFYCSVGTHRAQGMVGTLNVTE